MRNYISKIIDRGLQKRRESGITRYALYSFLIIISYKFIGLLKNINFEENLGDILISSIYVYNICIAILFMLHSYKMSFENYSPIRIIKTSKDSFYNLFLALTIVLLPLLISFGGFRELYNDGSHFNWYLILIGLIDSILFLLIAVVLIIYLFKKKEEKLYSLFDSSSKEYDPFSSKFFFFIAFLIIILSAYFYYLHELSIEKIDVLLLGVISFIILQVFIKIIDLNKQDVFLKDLENLEYEIFVKNMSDKEIRGTLQDKYLGFLIKDWSELKIKELNDAETIHDSYVKKIQKYQDELNDFDKTKYPFEFKGREKEFKAMKNGFIEEINSFYIKLAKELIDVYSNAKKMDDSEKEKLGEFKNNLLNKKKKYLEIFNKKKN